MLTVLREAGVSHDSSNRFVPGTIYRYKDELNTLFKEYTGAAVYTPEKEPEAEAAIDEG